MMNLTVGLALRNVTSWRVDEPGDKRTLGVIYEGKKR